MRTSADQTITSLQVCNHSIACAISAALQAQYAHQWYEDNVLRQRKFAPSLSARFVLLGNTDDQRNQTRRLGSHKLADVDCCWACKMNAQSHEQVVVECSLGDEYTAICQLVSKHIGALTASTLGSFKDPHGC